MEKLTSGGIDKGARPICDWLEVVAENARNGATWKAGTRKEGIDIEEEEAIALSSPLALALESIAVTEVNVVDEAL